MYKELLLINILLKMSYASLDSDISLKMNSSKILSRRKRYVVFPEGSSFQLVYCLTMPTYGMGQIFTMGLTAALAWELPHEPINFKDKKETENANKRIDKPIRIDFQSVRKPPVTQYHKPWSESSWTVYSNPQTPQFVINKSKFGQIQNKKHNFHYYKTFGREHEYQLPAYRNSYVYQQHRNVHRRTRRDLFGKIEKFFMAQNKDGRECLLKALCEVNQTTGGKKGTFIEEIIRAIFTWHPDQDERMDDYDGAATHKNNCSEIYSACSHSVWNVFF